MTFLEVGGCGRLVHAVIVVVNVVVIVVDFGNVVVLIVNSTRVDLLNIHDRLVVSSLDGDRSLVGVSFPWLLYLFLYSSFIKDPKASALSEKQ